MTLPYPEEFAASQISEVATQDVAAYNLSTILADAPPPSASDSSILD